MGKHVSVGRWKRLGGVVLSQLLVMALLAEQVPEGEPLEDGGAVVVVATRHGDVCCRYDGRHHTEAPREGEYDARPARPTLGGAGAGSSGSSGSSGAITQCVESISSRGAGPYGRSDATVLHTLD